MSKKNDGPTAIGDLLRLPPAVAKAAAAVSSTTGSGKPSPARKALSKTDAALIERSADIATNQSDGEDMAFTHSVLGSPRFQCNK